MDSSRVDKKVEDEEDDSSSAAAASSSSSAAAAADNNEPDSVAADGGDLDFLVDPEEEEIERLRKEEEARISREAKKQKKSEEDAAAADADSADDDDTDVGDSDEEDGEGDSDDASSSNHASRSTGTLLNYGYVLQPEDDAEAIHEFKMVVDEKHLHVDLLDEKDPATKTVRYKADILGGEELVAHLKEVNAGVDPRELFTAEGQSLPRFVTRFPKLLSEIESQPTDTTISFDSILPEWAGQNTYQQLAAMRPHEDGFVLPLAPGAITGGDRSHPFHILPLSVELVEISNTSDMSFDMRLEVPTIDFSPNVPSTASNFKNIAQKRGIQSDGSPFHSRLPANHYHNFATCPAQSESLLFKTGHALAEPEFHRWASMHPEMVHKAFEKDVEVSGEDGKRVHVKALVRMPIKKGAVSKFGSFVGILWGDQPVSLAHHIALNYSHALFQACKHLGVPAPVLTSKPRHPSDPQGTERIIVSEDAFFYLVHHYCDLFNPAKVAFNLHTWRMRLVNKNLAALHHLYLLNPTKPMQLHVTVRVRGLRLPAHWAYYVSRDSNRVAELNTWLDAIDAEHADRATEARRLVGYTEQLLAANQHIATTELEKARKTEAAAASEQQKWMHPAARTFQSLSQQQQQHNQLRPHPQQPAAAGRVRAAVTPVYAHTRNGLPPHH